MNSSQIPFPRCLEQPKCLISVMRSEDCGSVSPCIASGRRYPAFFSGLFCPLRERARKEEKGHLAGLDGRKKGNTVAHFSAEKREVVWSPSASSGKTWN